MPKSYSTGEKNKVRDFLGYKSNPAGKSGHKSPTASTSDFVSRVENKRSKSPIQSSAAAVAAAAAAAAAIRDIFATKEKREGSDFLPRVESKPSKTASQSSAAAVSNDVSRVASKLSSVLIEDSANQVEWIAEELRYIQTVLEDLDRGKGSNPDQLQLELVDDIRAVALDAEDVIESFTIKPYKRRQKGVEYLLDESEVSRELERISHRMREIRERIKNYEQTKLVVTIETPGLGRGATTMVSPALEKLDHILTQNLITLDEVIEKVEDMRDGYLWDVQNIVSNLISTGELSQREKVWLEEVKDLCDYTVDVAEKFIARTERLRDLWQVLRPSGQHAIEMNLMEQMECISTQFGDALYRRWTFGDEGKDMGDKIGSRSRPYCVSYTDLKCRTWHWLKAKLKGLEGRCMLDNGAPIVSKKGKLK